VLMIAVAGTTAVQVSFNRLAATSAETSAGMADLQACMERMLLEAPADLPIAGSDYEDGVPIAAYTDLHLDGETITPTYPDYAGGVVPDPLEIVLTLTFLDHQGRRRTLRLASMKTR
jgi:hypothetical protein